MGWPVPRLAPGETADVTVLDLGRERPVEAASFKSKARFSPWDGEQLFGWPVATFVRGQQVFARKD